MISILFYIGSIALVCFFAWTLLRLFSRYKTYPFAAAFAFAVLLFAIAFALMLYYMKYYMGDSSAIKATYLSLYVISLVVGCSVGLAWIFRFFCRLVKKNSQASHDGAGRDASDCGEGSVRRD